MARVPESRAGTAKPESMNSPNLFDQKTPSLAAVVERAGQLGVHQVAVVAWRDLDAPDAGGAEVHLAEVTRRWVEAGLGVSLRTAAVPEGPEKLRRNGVEVQRSGGRVSIFPGAALGVLRGELGAADGVVDVFQGMPFLSPLWAHRPRVGVIHHCHMGTWGDLAPPGLAQLGYLIERFGVRVLYRKTPLVTLSPSSAEEISIRMGIDRSRLRVGPVGVAEDFCLDKTVQKSLAPSVVAGGRFMPPKAFDRLVEVLVEVRQQVPDLTATIFGDGPGRQSVAAQVAAHGAAEWLRLPGFVSQEEKVRLYQEAWVLAAPSRREGWNMTVTEAAACGTPAVATDIPGHRDAVAEQKTGILVEGRPAMADALVHLLTDTNQRQSFADAAVERSKQFRWEHTAAVILNALCDDAQRRKS